MHKREKYFAMLNDNRIVHPFGWGEHFVGAEPAGDPGSFFRDYGQRMVEESETFYSLPEGIDFDARPADALETDFESVRTRGQNAEPGTINVSWESAIATSSSVNNIARGIHFPVKDDMKAAVVILPHWNAQAGTYYDLCRWFQRVGVSAFRLTMPYHEERMPSELERADYLVAPNIGRTLQSVRQSVLDTRAAVRWLKEQGYERVGIAGTSIGSCVGFFAFVHDEDIDAAVFNHVSGSFADVVWEGLSTYHVKEGLENDVTLEELRDFWRPIAPIEYMDKLKASRQRPQRYIYTLYDLTFPIHLTRQMMSHVEKSGVEHDQTVVPCGHYTLGEKPWVWLDGYKIISFLRKHLR